MADRIRSFDTLKGLALLFVVFIHAKGWFSVGALLDSPGSFLGFLLLSVSRFAVPCFFLVAGYLLHLKIRESGTRYVRGYLLSIGRYYVLGSGLFLVLQLAALGLSDDLGLKMVDEMVKLNLTGISGIIDFFYIGTGIAEHLWFLPALFFSAGLVYIAYRKGLVYELLAASLMLHAVGILSNAYRLIDFLPVPPNDAVFFGLFFTTTGFHISQIGFEPGRSRKYLLGTLLFGALNIVERILLSLMKSSGTYYWGEYTFFTAPFAVCLFLYALSERDWGRDSRIRLYGRYTLWGYILHPAVLGVFAGISGFLGSFIGVSFLTSTLWSLAATMLVYVLTMELSSVLSGDLRGKLRERASSII